MTDDMGMGIACFRSDAQSTGLGDRMLRTIPAAAGLLVVAFLMLVVVPALLEVVTR